MQPALRFQEAMGGLVMAEREGFEPLTANYRAKIG